MTERQHHVVSYSGGLGSWATAAWVFERFKPADISLVFCDTLMEDEDLYRFLDDTEADFGTEIVRLVEGRTPWQVYHDERFVGNTRADPCSKILKRRLFRRWLETHHEPDNTVVYLGIGWAEVHRLERAQQHWLPWCLQSPLCEPPYLSPSDIRRALGERGIVAPRLYDLGFPHNNCAGFCCKAGQTQFGLLLRTFPERYAHHEAQEAALRERLGKDVAILRDRTGGELRPLTLAEFRGRLENGQGCLPFDWGGCGCFLE